MNDARALSVIYRLLSRMDENAQDAAMGWLTARLAADREKVATHVRGMTSADKSLVRKSVGDAALSLMALMDVTGANFARRPVEMRGPTNADVMVSVTRVDLRNGQANRGEVSGHGRGI